MIASQSIDVFIGNKEMLEDLAHDDLLYHVDDFLTEEEKAAFEILSYEVVLDSDYMGRPTKVDGPFALVIKLPLTDWLTEIFGANREICLGIVGNAPNMENIHTLLAYFMGL